jgi:hypothetical protein
VSGRAVGYPPTMPRRNGRNRPRIPVNLVYRTIQAAGGQTAVCRALDVSLASLARWRRVGVVTDARAVLEWAALVHPGAPEAQLTLARRLAGLPAARRRSAQQNVTSART